MSLLLPKDRNKEVAYVLHEDRAAEAAALEGQYLNSDHYDQLITGDALALKPNGEVLFNLVKHVIPQQLCAKATRVLWNHVEGNSIKSTNRKTAIGPASGDDFSREGAIGFLDRQGGRLPYCRATKFNLNHPEKFVRVMPFVRAVDEVFQRYQPERWAAQMEKVQATCPDWIISGTAFSTITCNRNIRTKAHYDKGDYPQGMGVICALGRWCYGELIFPRYRVAVNFEPGDVLLCDVHELHGNAPLYGNRLALVFYYRQRMHECLSPEEEDERVNMPQMAM
jgi:hypothetical protein